ncbi:retrotransposon protein, putative, ty1-copia subclass [Tanacetum coccineum]
MGMMIVEFHAMLKLPEKGIPKKAETPIVLAIREGKTQKDKKKLQGETGKDNGKTKLAYVPKSKIPPPPKKDNPAKDSICHHCKEVGHRKRNCPSYHAELKNRKNRKQEVETWSFKSVRGNGIRVVVEAIGSFDLVLPSGLIIVLDNYHFVPSITRGVVSISRLVENGYIHTFTNYRISVSKDNMFYFNAIPRDGIYEIDMHNIYLNVCSMYNVSNKRAKHALDSLYLWHCHLGHINKKRMDKLQRDGILQPTHDESIEKCKSCISRKIAQLCQERVLVTLAPLLMISTVMGFAAALAVLVTEASQSRQYGKSESDLISYLPQSLFDVGSRRISIVTMNTLSITLMFWQYHKDNVKDS